MVHEKLTDTSSIGPQWPPKESSFNRIKGINTSIIRGTAQLAETIDVVQKLKEEYIDSDSGPIDRLSIRIIVDNYVLIQNLPLLEGIGEAVIPLSGTNPAFEHTSLLYLGCNSESRQSDKNDLKKAISNVETAARIELVSLEAAIKRANMQGFSVSILGVSDKITSLEVHEQMTKLYRKFGWKKKDVLDILSKPQNIIAVASIDGAIVSAGIAEVSAVNFQDGSKLRMAEITEAATDEKFLRKGLYSSVAARLMVELVNLSRSNQIDGGQIDFAYGECNGNELGVLKAVKSLGRTFSFETCRRLALPFKGYLSQHVPIAGAARNTPYNDLFPAYITREMLLANSK